MYIPVTHKSCMWKDNKVLPDEQINSMAQTVEVDAGEEKPAM